MVNGLLFLVVCVSVISVSSSMVIELLWLFYSRVIIMVKNSGMYVSVKLMLLLNLVLLLLLKMMYVDSVSVIVVVRLSRKFVWFVLFEWNV